MKKFAKTKILATIGPATSSREKLEAIIDAGADGIRLNFSHGDQNFFTEIFNLINEICISKSLPIPVLIDLQGPKIRIGQLSKPEVDLQSGSLIEITAADILGDEQRISTSYKKLADDAEPGDIILIDDGLIKLNIIEKKKDSVICRVVEGGILRPKKGMNLPGMKLSTESVTEKDFDNLEFALKHRVDYIALSFVRAASDITSLRNWMEAKGFDKPIIAKIEKQEAVENFEEILSVSDGIMVARGDLGVELRPHEVPIIQKKIIKRCNEAGKLVITATQMLESMVNNPVPTRAEASDVANAVWDGTDVVMLSAETSIGKFPYQTVKMMNEIISNAESYYDFNRTINFEVPIEIQENLFDSMNKGICSISRQINAKAIVAFTTKGNTPTRLSKFRPNAKIIAITDSFDAMNNLNLKWGVTSLYCKDISNRNKAALEVRKLILDSHLVEPGDVIIYTEGGVKISNIRENWIRFEVI
ncbi:MAG: pyruvate kinase [Melioribacteraceae bacterium]|nr:pyruvate kinase [Melioribacteraceae bacterium]